jgi:acylphosphatase
MYQLTIQVHGRVQGVGFRAFAYRTAQRLRLTGYVKNLPDGTLELVAEGSEFSLQELLEAIEQGPNHAHVTNVESSTVAIARASFPDFSIQH